MMNYAANLPNDKNNNVLQGFPPARLALVRRTNENATASSVVSLSHDTTIIEVAAVGGAAAIRWVAASDTQASILTVAGATSNYDHVISSGTLRQFVVPRETQALGQGSVVGINRGEGLYQRVALKSMGISSVLLSEY